MTEWGTVCLCGHMNTDHSEEGDEMMVDCYCDCSLCKCEMFNAGPSPSEPKATDDE